MQNGRSEPCVGFGLAQLLLTSEASFQACAQRICAGIQRDPPYLNLQNLVINEMAFRHVTGMD